MIIAVIQKSKVKASKTETEVRSELALNEPSKLSNLFEKHQEHAHKQLDAPNQILKNRFYQREAQMRLQILLNN